MNHRHPDVERARREDPRSADAPYYGDERYSGGPPEPVPGPGARRRRLRDRGPRGRNSRAWDWSDQVWSGRGRFDEGEIGHPRSGSASQPYAPGGYGRRVYGQDQYGWIEYDEPRYVASLYRGERFGEGPYREHEWERSKERPGLFARVYARGPKGYTRSDERIQDDISERLWRAEYIDSSEVTVAVENGVVKLTGTVPERWMRHAIEDVVDSCMGVQDLENNIRVLSRMTEEEEIETSAREVGLREPPLPRKIGTSDATRRSGKAASPSRTRIPARNSRRRVR
jgi:hypothetical protein